MTDRLETRGDGSRTALNLFGITDREFTFKCTSKFIYLTTSWLRLTTCVGKGCYTRMGDNGDNSGKLRIVGALAGVGSGQSFKSINIPPSSKTHWFSTFEGLTKARVDASEKDCSNNLPIKTLQVAVGHGYVYVKLIAGRWVLQTCFKIQCMCWCAIQLFKLDDLSSALIQSKLECNVPRQAHIQEQLMYFPN